MRSSLNHLLSNDRSYASRFRILPVSLHSGGSSSFIEDSDGTSIQLMDWQGMRMHIRCACRTRLDWGSGNDDLDLGSLDALMDELVGEGMGNILEHVLVKGYGNRCTGRSGTPMPNDDHAAVRDGRTWQGT